MTIPEICAGQAAGSNLSIDPGSGDMDIYLFLQFSSMPQASLRAGVRHFFQEKLPDVIGTKKPLAAIYACRELEKVKSTRNVEEP